jgi:hypothetical protein
MEAEGIELDISDESLHEVTRVAEELNKSVVCARTHTHLHTQSANATPLCKAHGLARPRRPHPTARRRTWARGGCTRCWSA